MADEAVTVSAVVQMEGEEHNAAHVHGDIGPSSDDTGAKIVDAEEDSHLEAIVKRRNDSDEAEYLVRLRDESSMWMRETDLTERAPRLLKEYMEKEEEKEKDEKEEQQNKRGIKRSLEDSVSSASVSHKKRKTGEKGATKALPSFANGDKVEEIVGARMIDGILHLFVMWKGKKTCSFVKAEECNKIIPHKVISFYESRLKFETPLKVNDRTLTASISS